MITIYHDKFNLGLKIYLEQCIGYWGKEIGPIITVGIGENQFVIFYREENAVVSALPRLEL